MDQGLKERLIGAAVLVALGVWLIPWVLDGKQEQLEVEASGSGLRLPSPDEPLPIRTQTLRLDEPVAEPITSDAVEQGSAGAAPVTSLVEPPVVVAEPDTRVARAAPELEPPRPEIAGAAKPVASSKPAPAPTEASKPAPTEESKPPASTASATAKKGDWVVQVGSFGEEENAKRQAQRVNTYGYKPEVSSIRANGRSMYRVRVGPYATRAQADATASSLAAHGFVAQVVSAD
jgi:DedD protein